MARWRNIFWIGTVLVLLLLIYEVGHRAQQLEADLQGVERQVAEERDAVHVLEAEWTYLTRPTRLQDLAARHSNLRPADHAQLIGLDLVPEPMKPLPAMVKPDSPEKPAIRPVAASGAAAPKGSLWEALHFEQEGH